MSEPVEEPAPNTKKRGRPRRGFGMKGAAANSVDTDKYAGPKRARAGPRPSRERSEQLANGARSTETAENMDRLTKMTKVLKNPAGNCRSFRENCSLLMSLVALLSMVFGGQGTGNSDYECKGFYTGGNPSFNKCVAHIVNINKLDKGDFHELWNCFDCSFDEETLAGEVMFNTTENRGQGSENYVSNAILLSQDQLLAIDRYIDSEHHDEDKGRTVRRHLLLV